jgi:ABC-type nickel/cobalt efflux system permease component RcnA
LNRTEQKSQARKCTDKERKEGKGDETKRIKRKERIPEKIKQDFTTKNQEKGEETEAKRDEETCPMRFDSALLYSQNACNSHFVTNSIHVNHHRFSHPCNCDHEPKHKHNHEHKNMQKDKHQHEHRADCQSRLVPNPQRIPLKMERSWQWQHLVQELVSGISLTLQRLGRIFPTARDRE